MGYCPPGVDGKAAYCDEKAGQCVACSVAPTHPACAESRYAQCKELCAKECAVSVESCDKCFTANGCAPQA